MLTRFAFSQRLGPVNEGNFARFFHPAVAGRAVLGENGADFAIEFHMLFPVHERNEQQINQNVVRMSHWQSAVYGMKKTSLSYNALSLGIPASRHPGTP